MPRLKLRIRKALFSGINYLLRSMKDTLPVLSLNFVIYKMKILSIQSLFSCSKISNLLPYNELVPECTITIRKVMPRSGDNAKKT